MKGYSATEKMASPISLPATYTAQLKDIGLLSFAVSNVEKYAKDMLLPVVGHRDMLLRVMSICRNNDVKLPYSVKLKKLDIPHLFYKERKPWQAVTQV